MRLSEWLRQDNRCPDLPQNPRQIVDHLRMDDIYSDTRRSSLIILTIPHNIKAVAGEPVFHDIAYQPSINIEDPDFKPGTQLRNTAGDQCYILPSIAVG